MKTMAITAGLILICSCAFAETMQTATGASVTCEVNGEVRTVNSASDCAALGGTMTDAVGPAVTGQGPTSSGEKFKTPNGETTSGNIKF